MCSWIRLQALQSVALDLVRIVAYRLQAGIGVALLVGEELAEEVGEMGQHFGGAGRAEADRVGHALVFGNAVVGEARGR